MNFDSFFADILATIVGGVFLTFLFFLLKEVFFLLLKYLVNGISVHIQKKQNIIHIKI